MVRCSLGSGLEGPEVDVIVPLYEGLPWVCDAIESALAQTYDRIRVVVVDDHSPDDSSEAVLGAFGGDPRLKVKKLEKNVGPPGARMEGVQEGSGDLIAFLDQDDIWDSRKLELQVSAMERERVDAIHCDVELMDEEGKVLVGAAEKENARRVGLSSRVKDGEAVARGIVRENRVRLGSVVVRRAAFVSVGGFNGQLMGGEDGEFLVRFLMAGYEMGHLARPLVNRRLHGGNLSRVQREGRLRGQLEALEGVVEQFPGLAGEAGVARKRIVTGLAREKLMQGETVQAREWAKEGVQLSGKWGRAGLLWLATWLGPVGVGAVELRGRVAEGRRGLWRRSKGG